MSKEKEEVDYGTLGFEVDDTALPLREVPKEEENLQGENQKPHRK